VPASRPSALRPWLAPLVLLVVVGGCGVKTNDAATATTPAPKSTVAPEHPSAPTVGPATTSPSGTSPSSNAPSSGTDPSSDTPSASAVPGSGLDSKAARDALIQGFIGSGLNKKQAICLAKGYERLGFTDPAKVQDLDFTKVTDLLDQCNVSISDFGQTPGGN